MKKKLLFVMDSLGIGGGEKSLVTLLSLIDYDRYDVDLQLFAYGGAFQQFLHPKVNILPELPYNRFLRNNLIASFCSFDFKKLAARIAYTYTIHTKQLNHAEKAMTYWQKCSRCYSETEKHYDVAIAYSQGLPTFYVVDKVKADKKIGWLNVDLPFSDILKEYYREHYLALNYIVAVSKDTNDYISKVFPNYIGKIKTIYDINDYSFIHSLSKDKSEFESKSRPIIITLARLNHQKGFDISLNACKLLSERNVDFEWHVFGNGPEEEKMRCFISDNNLNNIFFIHKPEPNPYKHLKTAALYVQTSRNEGFGLSIAEARMLNIPVITTEFSAVWSQMVQGKNGIVVPIDATAVADAIEDLILHPEKREAISAYQRTEKKGNTEEIEKFYKLIE